MRWRSLPCLKVNLQPNLRFQLLKNTSTPPPPCFPGGMLRMEAKKFNVCSIGPKNVVSLDAFKAPFGLWGVRLRSVQCCSDGWPSGTFSHLHTATGLLVGTYQEPFPQIDQFGWMSSSGKTPRCSKLWYNGGCCAPRNLQCSRHFCRLPLICASLQSHLWSLEVFVTKWFGITLMYRQIYSLLCTEVSRGGLQPSSRNNSKTMKEKVELTS